MASLRAVVSALSKERQRATKQIERIDAALAVLGSLDSSKDPHDVGSGTEEDCCGSAGPVAKVKAKKTA